MPNVKIEIARQYTPAQEQGLIDAVHLAMMDALKIPTWDRSIRLLVHEPHRFAIPPGRSDLYTLIESDLFAGWSLEAKKALYQAIVRGLTALGIPADDIKIL
jgi:phenylpyruvate tautomerase PptA (4-oxalocrotonate tautomerase family)